MFRIINPAAVEPPALSNATFGVLTTQPFVINMPIPDVNVTCTSSDANCSSVKWSVNSDKGFYSMTGSNENGWGYSSPCWGVSSL